MKRRFQFLLVGLLIFALVGSFANVSEATVASGGNEGSSKIVQSGVVKVQNQLNRSTTKFSDISKDYWAKEEIEYLVQHGIIKGYPNGTFGIRNKVTRSQAAIILARTLGIDKEFSPNPGFKDIPTTDPAYKEIAAVTKYGIFQKSTNFNPGGYLTRAQMAKIMTVAFDLKYTYATNFKDVERGKWYYHYVQSLAGMGITTGNNGKFMPNNHIDRTQFAVFLARILEDRFKVGLQASLEDAKFLSDGRLQMTVTLYNNTSNKIFDIRGKYSLHVDNAVIAQSDISKQTHPVSYGSLTLLPGQQKKLTFNFSSREVKKKVDLNKAQELFFAYEHTWKYYVK
ncbi:hypothetical protein J2S13_001684 [Oikeobacillus pervagus]|uniref:SLH domain-containing protein n=1 Tax=Oikeobacillus pervagus TaxID=1325931 RepID=A0AAJ1SYS1_9BACI|nr:S-layer homology domain-containing protein [Oikeobacillus pervagus]MDQ0215284.1 hypothetical protein [Oikeobacillus pervagus]